MNYELGHAESRPIYIVDEETGEEILIEYFADARMLETLVGVNAGNPVIDYNNLLRMINESIKKAKEKEELSKLEKELKD